MPNPNLPHSPPPVQSDPPAHRPADVVLPPDAVLRPDPRAHLPPSVAPILAAAPASDAGAHLPPPVPPAQRHPPPPQQPEDQPRPPQPPPPPPRRSDAQPPPLHPPPPPRDGMPLKQQVYDAIASQLADPLSLANDDPDTLHALIDEAIVEGLQLALQRAVDLWADDIIGAPRYAHFTERHTHRSGIRRHHFAFPVGQVAVDVPKPRCGPSRPVWIPWLKRTPGHLATFIRELWLRGLSTRDIAAASEEILGTSRSHETIARFVRDVGEDVLQWLNRPVRDDICYLILDGIHVPVCRETSHSEPVLVALGVTAEGHKEILDVACAPSENEEAWSSLLSRLKTRGLDVPQLKLVISDGAGAIIAAVQQQLPNVPRQRCTVHKVRNVVGHCPKELKKTAPAEASAIFQAESRDEALHLALEFIAKYRDTAPKVAAVIAEDLDATLTFYQFDATLWKALRSTNALERLNRELRRRFREVGAFKAGVNALRIAVQVAQFINEEAKDKPIAGFLPNRPRRQRVAA